MYTLILTDDEMDFLRKVCASDLAVTIKTADIVGEFVKKVRAVKPDIVKTDPPADAPAPAALGAVRDILPPADPAPTIGDLSQ